MPPQVKEIYDDRKNRVSYQDSPDTYDTGFTREAVDSIISLYDEARRWVPIAERLPDEQGCYLVCGTYGIRREIHDRYFYRLTDSEFQMAKRQDKNAVQWWFAGVPNPTHWQPLPLPPTND